MFYVYANATTWPCLIVQVKTKDTAKRIIRLLKADDPEQEFTIHTKSLE